MKYQQHKSLCKLKSPKCDLFHLNTCQQRTEYKTSDLLKLDMSQQRKLCTESQLLSLSRFQQRMLCRYFRLDIALHCTLSWYSR